MRKDIMLNALFDSFNEATRRFEYDYIFIDAAFLLIWLGILIKQKKWNPIKYGLFLGILVYIIDAVWWWNASAGANYPLGTTIREYWIDGVKMPHPLGEYFWIKSGADFMMCISYSLFAFGWLWIMYENYVKKNLKEIILYTSLFFGSWMLIPFISKILPINDTEVYTVRHMDSQMGVWISNVIIGYILFCIIYGTGKLRERDFKLIGYVFLVGCLESFFMEFPLFISGIRPTGIPFLIYEIFFLFNQGAPYLYILQVEVLPILTRKIKKNKLSEIELLTTS